MSEITGGSPGVTPEVTMGGATGMVTGQTTEQASGGAPGRATGMATGRRPVVGAAVLDRLADPTRLLVGRRSSPQGLAGLWEFPGGKVEPGEDPRAALRREVREELGVGIRLDREVEAGDPEGWLLGNGARMRVFTAVIEDGDPRPLQDHDLLEWCALEREALQSLEWIPADRPIVDALVEMLRG